MDEPNFPPNSRASQKPAAEEKKVERVTTHDAVKRKRPLSSRLKEMFFGSDARSVGVYIVADILVPAIKDIIGDVISKGVDRALWGEGPTGRRPSRGSIPSNGHTQYNRYSSQQGVPPSAWSRPQPQRPPMSQRGRAMHDFDEIILQTRPEAEAVLDQLRMLIDQYEFAKVTDLYTMVGIAPAFTDEKYGWTDLRGARVEKIRNGYLVDVPMPELLD